MIKTILSFDDIAELDAAVNEFEKTHNVFATQTDMILQASGNILHKATIFYKEVK